MNSSYLPGQGDQCIGTDIKRGEIVAEESCIPSEASDLKPLPAVVVEPIASGSGCDCKLLQAVFLGELGGDGMQQAVSAVLAKDVAASATAICDDTVKQGSFSRRVSLHWLMGKDKRMVVAAASAFPVPEAY